MSETFSKTGLFFDELNKIRVLEPDIFSQTEELQTECKDFVESKILNFLFSLSHGFLEYAHSDFFRNF